MRSGKYAIYRGKEYALGKMGLKWANLLCADPKSIRDGFIPNKYEHGTYCKRVKKTDLDAVYSVQTIVIYEDNRFTARKHNGTSFLIGTSDNILASLLDFTTISKHNYEKWVLQADCQEIYEDKIPSAL